jgi:hypothetical protein
MKKGKKANENERMSEEEKWKININSPMQAQNNRSK